MESDIRKITQKEFGTAARGGGGGRGLDLHLVVRNSLATNAVLFVVLQSAILQLPPFNYMALSIRSSNPVLYRVTLFIRIYKSLSRREAGDRSSVSDPHKFLCGCGSGIPKMSMWIWIRIHEGKTLQIRSSFFKYCGSDHLFLNNANPIIFF